MSLLWSTKYTKQTLSLSWVISHTVSMGCCLECNAGGKKKIRKKKRGDTIKILNNLHEWTIKTNKFM